LQFVGLSRTLSQICRISLDVVFRYHPFPLAFGIPVSSLVSPFFPLHDSYPQVIFCSIRPCPFPRYSYESMNAVLGLRCSLSLFDTRYDSSFSFALCPFHFPPSSQPEVRRFFSGRTFASLSTFLAALSSLPFSASIPVIVCLFSRSAASLQEPHCFF